MRSLPDWEHRSNRATCATFWPCELSLSTFLTTQGTQAFVGKRGAPPKDHKNLMRALSIFLHYHYGDHRRTRSKHSAACPIGCGLAPTLVWFKEIGGQSASGSPVERPLTICLLPCLNDGAADRHQHMFKQ